ncbi:MAG: hypothetical protein WBF53_16600 [Litorimonas sp.]
MTLQAGVPLYDLLLEHLDLGEHAGRFPDKIANLLRRFNAVGLSSTLSPASIFHSGHLQPVSSLVGMGENGLDIGIGRLHLPALTRGVPFHLSLERAALGGTETLEGPPSRWQLDLVLNVVDLEIAGLKPATFVPASGTTTRHLVPDGGDKGVHIRGTGTLRLSQSAGGDVVVSFIDRTDPFDPTARTGGAGRLYFDPPHFLIGTSEFGMSVRDFVYDGSETYSPQDILERNQGPAWMGLAIKEATFYAPRTTPVVQTLSGGVKDLLLGSPTGMQGELEIQFGQDALNPSTFKFEQEVTEAGTTSRKTLDVKPSSQRDGNYIVTFEGDRDEVATIDVQLSAGAPPASDTLKGVKLTEWHVEWEWRAPESTSGIRYEGDATSQEIGHGWSLIATPFQSVTYEDDSTERFKRTPLTFRFRSRPPDRAGLHLIVKKPDGTTFNNVAEISGSVATLAGLVVSTGLAHPDAEQRWTVSDTDVKATGETFELTPERLESLMKRHVLTVASTHEDSTGKIRTTRARLFLDIREKGVAIVGAQNGAWRLDTDERMPVRGFIRSADLSEFHESGLLRTNYSRPEITATPPFVVAAPDTLAKVALTPVEPVPALTADEEDAIRLNTPERHIRLLMEFGETEFKRWDPIHKLVINGKEQTFGSDEGAHSQLLQWANQFPKANFLVVGRCDDIQTTLAPGVPNDGDPEVELPDGVNPDLSKKRAKRGLELLTTQPSGSAYPGIDKTRVDWRGEFFAWTGSGAAWEDDAEDHLQTLPEKHRSQYKGKVFAPDPDTTDDQYTNWLIKIEHPKFDEWVNEHDPLLPYEKIRKRYRCVDFYALGGEKVDKDGDEVPVEAPDPDPRDIWIPSEKREPDPLPQGDPALAYRVRLVVRWDSPSVSTPAEAIPTLAEAEFVWSPAKNALPDIPLGNGSIPMSPKPIADPSAQAVSPGSEFYTIGVKWVHDNRTGFTQTALRFGSEGGDGLFAFDQRMVVAALTLGPVLGAGADADNEVFGGATRTTALLAGAGFANFLLSEQKTQSVFKGIEAQWEARALEDPDQQQSFRLLVDYTNTLNVDIDTAVVNVKTTRPMKVRFKGVGISFDRKAESWDGVGFVFDNSKIEVEDAGQWEIDGQLGKFVRIVEIATGLGSLWVEMRIAVALEIGLIKVSEAKVRVTFEKDANGQYGNPKFELRGFTVSADVPNVLSGEGRLQIEDGGAIRAGIDADIIPLQLKANAAIAFARPSEIDPKVFLTVGIGVQFSTPLVLGTTGLAIYGMNGLFVMNGARKRPNTEDPIARELGWWGTPTERKYDPQAGQFALGVGVVVGTLPDASFSFSAAGMVVVGFPDVEVILGIDVEVLTVPGSKQASNERGSSTSATGLITISDEGAIVAVSIDFEIPKLVKVKIPFGAYFPTARDEHAFIRLGSDGVTAQRSDGATVTRYGEPVSATLFPGLLDYGAWAYLMIEEGGLPNLGGNTDFSFDGFAVGFGAGFGINWSAGPIRLSASASTLVGFGTDPLLVVGGVFVAGELDLKVVSISARGELVLSYSEDDLRLTGKFCGEVDLFFFSLKGCVGVSFGGDSEAQIPPPPEPVTDVALTDGTGRVMGYGAPDLAGVAAKPAYSLEDPGTRSAKPDVSPRSNNTVWPDTAPVLTFRHGVVDAFTDGADANRQFQSPRMPTQPLWFGGQRLKYAYRIRSVQLVDADTGQRVSHGSGRLPASWTDQTFRRPDSSGTGGNPLPSEHESPQFRLLDWNPTPWLADFVDGGGGVVGQVEEVAISLCEDEEPPRPACLLGHEGRRVDSYSARFVQGVPAPGPYPSRFRMTGGLGLAIGNTEIDGETLSASLAANGIVMERGAVTALPAPLAHDGRTFEFAYRLPRGTGRADGAAVRTALPWTAKFDRPVRDTKVTLLICEGLDGRRDAEEDAEICYAFEGVKPSGRPAELRTTELLFKALDSSDPLQLVDRFHLKTFSRVRDGQAEIALPKSGMEIVLLRPARQVSLGIFKVSDGPPVQITAFAGEDDVPVYVDGSSAPVGNMSSRRMQHPDGIRRIRILGGDGLDTLVKICRRGFTGPPIGDGDRPGEPAPHHHCDRFEGLDPDRMHDEMIEWKGYRFTALKRNLPLKMADRLDDTSGATRRGRDGIAELEIPSEGLEISLPHPCAKMVLWVWLDGPDEVVARGLDANGKVVTTSPSGRQTGRAYPLTLQPPQGKALSSVILSGGSGESLLFRICCEGETIPSDIRRQCTSFRTVDLDPSAQEGVVFANMRLIPAQPAPDALRLEDRLDLSTNTPRVGKDGLDDLVFAEPGMTIVLDDAAIRVAFVLAAFKSDLEIEALDRQGRVVATAKAARDPKAVRHLELTGSDIREIRMRGHEVALAEICCDYRVGAPAILDSRRNRREMTPDLGNFREIARDHFRNQLTPTRVDHIVHVTAEAALKRSVSDLGGLNASMIRTLSGRLEVADDGAAERDDPARTSGKAGDQDGGTLYSVDPDDPLTRMPDTWKARTVATFGKCRIVEYSPASEDAVRAFQYIGSGGEDVSLLSVCGVDDDAYRTREGDSEYRKQRRDTTQDVGRLPVPQRRPIVLDPDTRYRVDVEWDWKAWESNEKGDDHPPAAADPTIGWQTGGTQSFHFATAPLGLDPKISLDGPNEHVFDPKDVERYLHGVEPEDGRSAHFRDDPIWVHFKYGHVGQLLQRYGRTLFIDVRRTDPPPAPGGRETSVRVPAKDIADWLPGPEALASEGERRVNAALRNAPCLSVELLLGGASLTRPFELEPNAMYDLALVAKSEDGSPDRRIHATRFVSSRYRDPGEMMEHLGFPRGEYNPYRPKEIVLDGDFVAPDKTFTAGDKALDQVLRQNGLDTLQLPQDNPVTYLIWQKRGNRFELAGVLLDALEPLRRQGSVKHGATSEIVERCAPLQMKAGPLVLHIRRATTNWTRLLFTPDQAQVPGDKLDFDLSVNGRTTLTGSRRISSKPAILINEGLIR